MYKFGFYVLLISALLMSCGKDKNSNTHVQENAAAGSISVNVSDGNPISRPVYSWLDTANDTTAMQLTVARTSAQNTPVWGVTSNPSGQNLIQSPWPHGSFGGSVSETVSAERDLQTNIAYRVTVTRADGNFGYLEFTVLP